MTTPDQRGLREILENAWASREQLGQELFAWAARHGEAVREACLGKCDVAEWRSANNIRQMKLPEPRR